jgi:hypothetical protein
MITWAEDTNLDRICAGINKHIINYEMKDYYIFGLQQEDRPHVRITPKCPAPLKDLFIKSGYSLEVRNTERYCSSCDATHAHGNCHCDTGCEYCDPSVVGIGLRRDIRKDIASSKKLIKTIIFAIEDKLILSSSSKLSLPRVKKK